MVRYRQQHRAQQYNRRYGGTQRAYDPEREVFDDEQEENEASGCSFGSFVLFTFHAFSQSNRRRERDAQRLAGRARADAARQQPPAAPAAAAAARGRGRDSRPRHDRRDVRLKARRFFSNCRWLMFVPKFRDSSTHFLSNKRLTTLNTQTSDLLPSYCLVVNPRAFRPRIRSSYF